jgi:hypothetical protein
LVGWSRNLEPPKFPKDDRNVSKKATPESKGARPCRHCGSGKHWDNECKHSFKGNRAARANLASTTNEDHDALEEYNDLYYSLDTDDEVESGNDSNKDFDLPLQTTEALSGSAPALEGGNQQNHAVENSSLEQYSVSENSLRNSTVTACTTYRAKPALNRRTRRRLAKDIESVNYHVRHSTGNKPLVELRKYMARPPGCSFLGARATEATATVGGLDVDPLSVIIDSGSDITLISEKALESLTHMPRTKAGQRINLIQVTGKSVISGYVTLDLYFHTDDGPVKLTVEAYVVKGMTTPFILGNDFSDQYSISVVRREGESYLVFGDSGREINVATSTSPALMDEDGHAFKVRVLPGIQQHGSKAQIHRKHQKLKRRERLRRVNHEVRSEARIVISPETSVAVPVKLHFPKGQNSAFVERSFHANGGTECVYGSPDMLISKDRPLLHVANFSSSPITISSGQVLGTARNPKGWLDRMDRYSKEKQNQINAHATLMRCLVNEKLISDEQVANVRRGEADSETSGPTDEVNQIDQLSAIFELPSNSLNTQAKCEHCSHVQQPVTNFEDDCPYCHAGRHGTRANLSSNIARSVTDISSKAQRNATEADDPLAEEPLEGGPKTSEVPEESIPGNKLLSEVDISRDLTVTQRRELEAMILRNQLAFGIDGRLGNYEGKIDIPMKPGSEPVSLPPFPVSPANREVIDKQMDSWIQLGVIEPSKSPWAAPVFIVYRNGKPRMVIDLRKLNEMVVADEFPLPRQEDILQALSGSQWLTTLDALAGFTQLTMSDSAAEKLAFRTHRGLWQFRRMPFGYRNGPSVFQRVMHNVLAPFLWIFALVYIDDIVVFSLTFEEHIRHLDQVFSAISAAHLTLSPGKCHFAYQSLLLLGQKVSRLGLSTHKEKVDAILQLNEPRNVHELQQFLGMMVYFSAYVPFYSWIAHPLFQLLKKGIKWEWTELEQEAFEICKQVLTNAPVRGYAMAGRPFRVYSDACDYGLAAILQQVQPILIRDLRGTRLYERLERAFKSKEPIPVLVTAVKGVNDIPLPGEWALNFEDTTVHIERVICYWSRVLKSPERNYSPTEREALALKEALIKFQPFLEGETVIAITDHAALT